VFVHELFHGDQFLAEEVVRESVGHAVFEIRSLAEVVHRIIRQRTVEVRLKCRPLISRKLDSLAVDYENNASPDTGTLRYDELSGRVYFDVRDVRIDGFVFCHTYTKGWHYNKCIGSSPIKGFIRIEKSPRALLVVYIYLMVVSVLFLFYRYRIWSTKRPILRRHTPHSRALNNRRRDEPPLSKLSHT